MGLLASYSVFNTCNIYAFLYHPMGYWDTKTPGHEDTETPGHPDTNFVCSSPTGWCPPPCSFVPSKGNKDPWTLGH